MKSLQPLADHWPQIDALLDEALALPREQRADWLAQLSGPHAALRDTVARLLDAEAAAETDDFMQAPPPVRLPPSAGHPDDGEPTAGDRVGPYRLIEPLGRGGMGVVWLAERADGALQRQVALKLPRLAWRRTVAERLARERDILATLDHPHIARLLDAGADAAGRPFIALERVQGQRIDEHCRTRALPLRARLELLLQVAAAVAHAHAKLVVHRDLKPGNILVTPEGQVRLLDFGIAKLLEGELTQETALTRQAGAALTPDYASPEQIRGEPLSTASDIYSLAVVAYEVLAGVRPYRLKRGTAAELEEAIASAEPPLASSAAADPAAKKGLRGDLDAILNRALKKAPEARYASVDALAEDWRRHLRGDAVLARPDGWRYRSTRFLRRHWVPASASAAVVMALAAGTTVALWQAQRAREQAADARAEAEAKTVFGEFMFGSFSRIAADPALATDAAREAIARAVAREAEKAEKGNKTNAKALAEIYGNASAMSNYLQRPLDTQAYAAKELQALRDAKATPRAIAQAHRQLALAHYRLGQVAPALQQLGQAVGVLQGDGSEGARVERARALRSQSIYRLLLGEAKAARDAAEAARRELEPDLRRRSHFHGAATIELARALHVLGEDTRAWQLLAEVEADYRAIANLAETEWAGLEFARAALWVGLGHHAQAEAAWARSGELYARQFGRSGSNAAGLAFHRARALAQLGRFEAARATASGAAAMLTTSPEPLLQERGRAVALELAVSAGDLPHARELAEAAVTAQLPAQRLVALHALTRLHLASGQLDAARRALGDAAAVVRDRFGSAARPQQEWLLLAAEVDLAGGRPSAVHTTLAPLPAPAADTQDWTLWRAADLRAAAALAQGQTAAALAWFESPLAHLGRPVHGAPVDDSRRSAVQEVQARLAFGEALLAAGRRAEAGPQFDRAVERVQEQHAALPLRLRVQAAAVAAR